MFNLTPRFSKKNYTSTPSNLGPNTYYVYSDKEYFTSKAPFLTSATRVTGGKAASYTQALYNPEENRTVKIRGGASVKYTAKRLKYSKNDTPGPANYDPKPIEKGQKSSPRPHGVGRLYVCRVPFGTTVSGPSVPTHIDENGYELNQFGNLIKMPPTEHDLSLGPAFYKVPRHESNVTTALYHKGFNWSKSNCVRFKKLVSTTPGVGEYNLDTAPRWDPDQENFRELARLFSFLPRLTDSAMMKATREDFPAPNQYNYNNSVFTFKEPASVVPIPFVSGAARFKYTTSDVPAPTDYSIDGGFGSKQQFSCKEVPFDVGAERWKNNKSNDGPSPNAYTIIGSVAENLKNKSNIYSYVDAPFATTAKRKMDFMPANDNPGPADYDVEDTEVPKIPINASFFKSQSRRFKYSSSDDAGPASYNITEPYKKNTNRKSHNAGKVPFQSTVPRSKELKLETPGPADYIGQGNMKLKGLSIGCDARFKEKFNETPAPGTYSLHPSIGYSLYKGVATHNLRLKENVMRTKVRLSPAARRFNWYQDLQRKKKLRWFAKPTEEYIHCVTTV